MMGKTKMALAAGGAVLALVGGGVGVAYAANDSTPTAAQPSLSQAADASSASSAPSSSASSAPSSGTQQGKGRKAKRRKALLNRVEHGEFTLHTKKGDRVVDVQRGQVTSVSASQLQVKSVDGFTASYVVDGTTKVRKDGKKAAVGDVKSGDKVVVTATKSGSTVTAKLVRDPKQK